MLCCYQFEAKAQLGGFAITAAMPMGWISGLFLEQLQSDWDPVTHVAKLYRWIGFYLHPLSILSLYSLLRLFLKQILFWKKLIFRTYFFLNFIANIYIYINIIL